MQMFLLSDLGFGLLFLYFLQYRTNDYPIQNTKVVDPIQKKQNYRFFDDTHIQRELDNFGYYRSKVNKKIKQKMREDYLKGLYEILYCGNNISVLNEAISHFSEKNALNLKIFSNYLCSLNIDYKKFMKKVEIGIEYPENEIRSLIKKMEFSIKNYEQKLEDYINKNNNQYNEMIKLEVIENKFSTLKEKYDELSHLIIFYNKEIITFNKKYLEKFKILDSRCQKCAFILNTKMKQYDYDYLIERMDKLSDDIDLLSEDIMDLLFCNNVYDKGSHKLLYLILKTKLQIDNTEDKFEKYCTEINKKNSEDNFILSNKRLNSYSKTCDQKNEDENKQKNTEFSTNNINEQECRKNIIKIDNYQKMNRNRIIPVNRQKKVQKDGKINNNPNPICNNRAFNNILKDDSKNTQFENDECGENSEKNTNMQNKYKLQLRSNKNGTRPASIKNDNILPNKKLLNFRGESSQKAVKPSIIRKNKF